MTKTTKPLTIAVFSVTILTSCLTAKKVDTQVAKQYVDRQQGQKKKQNELISITSPLISADKRISTTETKTSKVLPLLLYWSWDYKNTCTLNPQIPINNFTATVLNYANHGLNEKIKGQKLQLVVDKIPNQFAIDDKANIIF